MLKYRDQPGAGFPPQGYIFYQPQTNWHSTPGFTFWQTVDEIIAMRLKNPRYSNVWATTREQVANELDYFTCLRLNNNPQYCTPLTDTQKKTPSPGTTFPPQLQPRPAGVVAAARNRAENFGAGVGVVLDWLGDSLEPVDQALAEKRAAICTKPCPQNGRPDFIQTIEGWAASGVKELIQLARDMKLRTSRDRDLHHCQACDCALKLKVWCKMDHILAHTNERVMEELPDWCWIKNQDGTAHKCQRCSRMITGESLLCGDCGLTLLQQ